MVQGLMKMQIINNDTDNKRETLEEDENEEGGGDVIHVEDKINILSCSK